MILNVLAALVILLAALGVRRHAVVDGRIELNAFLFFSLGFLYYWIFPLLFAANAEALEVEGLDLPARVAQAIPRSALLFYGALCVLAYACFLLGYRAVSRVPAVLADYPAFPTPVRGLKSLLVLAVLVAAAAAVPVRSHLFKGYTEELFEGYEEGVLADALPRGTFVAAVGVLFVLSLMLASQQASRSARPRDLFLSKTFAAWAVFEVLVLSMGGRLYFVSHLLSLLAFWSVRYRGLVRPSRLALLVLAGLAVLGAGGVIRAEGSDFSWIGVVTNVGQEPGLMAISLFSFLEAGRFPALNAPIFLASDFLNLVPSVLFPDKLSWALRPQDYGYTVEMPLGGLHLLVSLMVNFGWLGGLAVFGAIGAGLAWLRGRVGSWLGSMVYALVCGWVTFSLFRDPLSVSLVKNIVQYSILVPLLVFHGLRSAGRVEVDWGGPPRH